MYVMYNNCCYSLKIEKKKVDILLLIEGRMFGCFLEIIYFVYFDCGVSLLCVCDILIILLE